MVQSYESPRPAGSGSGLKLLLAWGFVGIPLLWGVIKTVQNSLQLFQ